MTGRIESTLKDIHRAVEERVQEWMRINYIETLTYLPKAVFFEELLRQAKCVMVNSLPIEVSDNLNKFLYGAIDCNLQPTKFSKQEVANNITKSVHDRLGVAPLDEKTLQLRKEIEDILTGYGVVITQSEATWMATEMVDHYVPGSAKIRDTIVARYVAGKDINLINQCLSFFKLAEMPVDYVKTVRKLLNFFSTAVKEVSEAEKVVLLDHIRQQPILALHVGTLRCIAGQNGIVIPQITVLVGQIENLLNTALAKNCKIITTDEIWDEYKAMYCNPASSQQPMQSMINPVYYDQLTSIRIGQQVDSILTQSAIGYNNELFQRIIHQVMKLEVTCPRSVEIVTKACASNSMSVLQQRLRFIEAVLWNIPAGIVSHNSAVITQLANEIESNLRNTLTNDFTGTLIKAACTSLTKIQLVEDNTKNSQVEKTVTPKVQMLVLEESFYRSIRSDDELVVSREYGIHPVSEMPLQGAWVIRNFHTGEFIDSDKYLNDLVERHNLNIEN